jgi:hypothetical protein
MAEGETHFWEVFYSGVFKADRPKQAHAQGKNYTLKRHTKQLQTISRTHMAINKQLQESHGALQVPMMPKRTIFEG